MVFQLYRLGQIAYRVFLVNTNLIEECVETRVC